MFIAKITHCPFDEIYVSSENMTKVTEITSEGLNYLQFCSAIGQIAFSSSLSKIEIHFVSDESSTNHY